MFAFTSNYDIDVIHITGDCCFCVQVKMAHFANLLLCHALMWLDVDCSLGSRPVFKELFIWDYHQRQSSSTATVLKARHARDRVESFLMSFQIEITLFLSSFPNSLSWFILYIRLIPEEEEKETLFTGPEITQFFKPWFIARIKKDRHPSKRKEIKREAK